MAAPRPLPRGPLVGNDGSYPPVVVDGTSPEMIVPFPPPISTLPWPKGGPEASIKKLSLIHPIQIPRLGTMGIFTSMKSGIWLIS